MVKTFPSRFWQGLPHGQVMDLTRDEARAERLRDDAADVLNGIHTLLLGDRGVAGGATALHAFTPDKDWISAWKTPCTAFGLLNRHA